MANKEKQALVDEMVRLQTDRYATLSRVFSNFKKDSVTRKTPIYFQSRVDSIETLSRDFTTTHNEIIRQELASQHEYVTQKQHEAFAELYLEVYCHIKEQQATLHPVAAREEPPLSSSTSRKSVKLPTLPIPSFSGKYVDWSGFYDGFHKLVHCNDDLTAVQKFHFLKQALPTTTDLDIHQMNLNEANYETAWNLIVKRYNNPRILFTHQMNLLYNIPFMSKEQAEDIKSMLNVANVCVNAFRQLKLPIDQCDHWVAHFLASRLAKETHKAWELSLGSKIDIPSFTELETFLNNRLVMLDAVENRNVTHVITPTPKQSTNPSISKFSRRTPKVMHAKATPHAIQCALCNGNHILRRCSLFLAKDSYERKSIVDAQKLCLNCLNPSHLLAQCPSTKNCQQCGQRHHTLLHFPTAQADAAPNPSSSSSSRYSPINAFSSQRLNGHEDLRQPNGTGQASSSSSPAVASGIPQCHTTTTPVKSAPTILLATALVTLLNPETHQRVTLRALIDQGSECSLISENAAQALNLKRRPTTTHVQGIGQGSSKCKHIVDFTLCSRINPHFQTYVENVYILSKLTSHIPRQSIPPGTWPHLQNVQLADPTYHIAQKIDVLLGADVFAAILLPETKIGNSWEPIGQHTQLGWIISGRTRAHAAWTPTIHCNHASTHLDDLVKSFYELEHIPNSRALSEEDKWCESFFQSTHARQANGKYMVRLPLKTLFDPSLSIGKSKQQALNRFHQLERKLNRQPQLKERYADGITEYFTLNQIRPATTTEEQHCHIIESHQITTSACVLPHHAVIKEESVSTKVRIVFDASMKTTNGNSLNDILCIGPPLQNDLSAVILNWRLHRFVFIADIQRMYRCIEMHPEDAEYQRIWWRNDDSDLQQFTLTTVTFGTASAPYTAIRVLHQLAEDERHRFPLAESVIKNDIYVDDVQTGSDTIEQALEVKRQVTLALRSAGMELRKWASNTSRLLSDIPAEHQSNSSSLQFHSEDTIKTLGICWQPNRDIFKFQVTLNNYTPATKRSVLSVIARIFDPLGLLAPVIVSAKIQLKTIWNTRIARGGNVHTGLDWDEQLPDNLNLSWQSFLRHLEKINCVHIPRWLDFSPDTIQDVQLHTFCDGSYLAYAASVYLRLQYDSGHIVSHLITAKTKVTPTNPLTIPRVELCGAVLAVDLIEWVKRHFTIYNPTVPIYYWTDATTILYWIKGDISKLKTFVANRIGKIAEHSSANQWKYVNTHENPADCATRGLSPTELAHFDLWWHGPSWLTTPSTNWPAIEAPDISSEIDLTEEREPVIRVFFTLSEDSVNRPHRKIGLLSVEELQTALHIVIRITQLDGFSLDISHLAAQRPLPCKSKLRNLNPFLDEHQVLRVGGRLQNSTLSLDRKHPMILPSNHHVTRLLINQAHQATLHGGAQLTLSTLRQRFWILRGRQTVQRHLQMCVRCFRNRPKVIQQLMGNLPLHRINPPHRPFLATGVDFTGAIELKASRYRGNTTYKGYIAIFICLATKAVHLEAVTGLSTECFMWALQRFISRRGVCHDIYSDNGTNFLGADRLLQRERKSFLEAFNGDVLPQITAQQISWHFNPPYSPNFGGLWEANVKSVKHHLKRIVCGASLTYEHLSTVLARIESCLNSRPLCPLTDDPQDIDALTPGHFLIGDALLAPPEAPPENVCLPQLFLRHQQMLQQFWKKWSSDWLSHLQTRPKWQRIEPNLKMNELVIVKDDRLPPNEWILGRIVELHPGHDGLVRVASLRTKLGVIKRSISKLCRLPLLGGNV